LSFRPRLRPRRLNRWPATVSAPTLAVRPFALVTATRVPRQGGGWGMWAPGHMHAGVRAYFANGEQNVSLVFSIRRMLLQSPAAAPSNETRIAQALVAERPDVLPPVPSTERAMPSSPEEFREFAQECLRWAGETKSERHRQALLETARTWIQAALEVERSGLRRNAHFANLGPARPGSRLRLLAESAQ
jgi:hypothetical protein